MKQSHRNYLIYVFMLLVLGGMIFGALKTGEYHATSFALSAPETSPSQAFHEFCSMVASNLHHPLALLLVQIVVILVVVRCFAALFRLIGQPGVIGEIVAGIVLGPSLLGWVWPEAYAVLFRPDSLGILEQVSQIGLLLFMFVIGLEVDFTMLKNKMNATIVISHAGIFSSFFLGILASIFIYEEYAKDYTPFLPFALFLGISMSVTAFPVLARIIQERGMTKKPVGLTTIASAANDDVTAWCLLAVVIAIAKAGSLWTTVYTVLITLVYFAVMFLVVRPLLKKIGELYASREVMDKRFVSSIFLVFVISSVTTELLGIHALLGAFLAGVVMPTNAGFRKVMTEKVEDIASVFFLPLFFAFMGLRTEIGLINTPSLWWVCLFLILIAILGKLGGCALAARAVGQSWKDSLLIGTLMNARGLMQLVVLDIGYEMGILPPSIFVILVLMALFTTFMTTPLLRLVEIYFARHTRHQHQIQILKQHREEDTADGCEKTEYAAANEKVARKLLLCFGRPESGRKLLRIYRLLYGPDLGGRDLIAAHYTLGTDVNPSNAEQFAEESFLPITSEAKRLNIRFDKLYRTTDSFIRELKQLVRTEHPSMLLLGAGPRFMTSREMPLRAVTPFFNLFRGKIDDILAGVDCTVGIYSARGGSIRSGVDSLAILLGKPADEFLLEYIPQLLSYPPGETISAQQIHIYWLQENYAEPIYDTPVYTRLADNHPGRLHFHPLHGIQGLVSSELPENTALMLLSYETCADLVSHTPIFPQLPSLLVLKEGQA